MKFLKYFWECFRALPGKTRVLMHIAPESWRERLEKPLSQVFLLTSDLALSKEFAFPTDSMDGLHTKGVMQEYATHGSEVSKLVYWGIVLRTDSGGSYHIWFCECRKSRTPQSFCWTEKHINFSRWALWPLPWSPICGAWTEKAHKPYSPLAEISLCASFLGKECKKVTHMNKVGGELESKRRVPIMVPPKTKHPVRCPLMSAFVEAILKFASLWLPCFLWFLSFSCKRWDTGCALGAWSSPFSLVPLHVHFFACKPHKESTSPRLCVAFSWLYSYSFLFELCCSPCASEWSLEVCNSTRPLEECPRPSVPGTLL